MRSVGWIRSVHCWDGIRCRRLVCTHGRRFFIGLMDCWNWHDWCFFGCHLYIRHLSIDFLSFWLHLSYLNYFRFFFLAPYCNSFITFVWIVSYSCCVTEHWSVLPTVFIGFFRSIRSDQLNSTPSLSWAYCPNCQILESSSMDLSDLNDLNLLQVVGFCFGFGLPLSLRWVVFIFFVIFCDRHLSSFSSSYYFTRSVYDSEPRDAYKFVTYLFALFSFIESVSTGCYLHGFPAHTKWYDLIFKD